MLQKISKVLLYSLSFPENEIKSKEYALFSSKEEAEICAKLKLGWYGSIGSVYIKEYSENDKLPKYFDTAKEWAKTYLTVNDYFMYFKEL